MEQVDNVTHAARVAGLVDDLASRGIRVPSRWRDALLAVPRHLFVPDTAWAHPDRPGDTARSIDRRRDPAIWWDTVYGDYSIVLQLNDSRDDPASGRGEFTSALSAPGVALRFLELLEPMEHDRVLEIGTGSGWTAALLTSQLGSGQVTSIEVDSNISALAAKNLAAADLRAHLVIADGAEGRDDGAPYDRVHATCGVRTIPPQWISQTRPGGVIVVPWMPGGALGWQLRLTIGQAGTAVGRVHGAARYMLLRSQRHNQTWQPHHGDRAAEAATRIDPRAVATAPAGAQLTIIPRAPGIGWHEVTGDDGGFSLLLYELDDPWGSWAGCYYRPGCKEYQVIQYGARCLWDEVAAAYRYWISLGAPDHERLGLTVTEQGHHVLWLDTPERPLGEVGAAHSMPERA